MDQEHPSNLNRRRFLQGLGTSAALVAVSKAQAAAENVNKAIGGETDADIQGPGTVPVVLKINGSAHKYIIEPRVTVLDALRNYNSLTAAKEGCDRATCGACSVFMDGKLVYACMVLAIDAQGHEITTLEGISKNGLTPVQKAFVECDALMCGYCTPGFVMAVTHLLEQNPKPTVEEVKTACSGNLCRCGTYPHILHAAMMASGAKSPAPYTMA